MFTSDKRQATSDKRQATSDKRQATSDKNFIKWIFKAVTGGISAFVVLNLFCLIYYTVPAKGLGGEHSTDHTWKTGGYSSQLTEGFGSGIIDKYGYWNDRSLAENPNPDILVIGSSHVEALQLSQKQNLTYLLDSYFDNLDAYSIGMSGNFFLNAVKNLENALRYKKPEYAVIETSTVSFTDSEIEQLFNGELPDVVGAFPSNKLLEIVSQTPYLQLMYRQLENLNGDNTEISSADKGTEASDKHASKELLNALAERIHTISEQYGATPIIFYHPHLTINADGTVTPQTDETDLRNFAAACKDNNVIFLDLTDTFVDAYYDKHILPHGFFNSEIGTGHLNADGHRMAAEQLAALIGEVEI